MRLIILAAGRGERLWPLTKDFPKSMLPIGNGKIVLQTQLGAAAENGIDDVVVIVGYLHTQVEDYIAGLYPSNVRTIYNPFFDVSNNLYSLWMAKWLLEKQDIIVLNGDTIVNPTVMSNLIQDRNDFVMTIDRKTTYDADDMKVVTREGVVERVGKDIPLEKSDAESIGMIKFGGDKSGRLVTTLDCMVREDENRDSFWLAAIQRMVDDGDSLGTLECTEDDWAEIDFHSDLELVRRRINDQTLGFINRMSRRES